MGDELVEAVRELAQRLYSRQLEEQSNADEAVRGGPAWQRAVGAERAFAEAAEALDELVAVRDVPSVVVPLPDGSSGLTGSADRELAEVLRSRPGGWVRLDVSKLSAMQVGWLCNKLVGQGAVFRPPGLFEVSRPLFARFVGEGGVDESSA